jgi:hypothetical protein
LCVRVWLVDEVRIQVVRLHKWIYRVHNGHLPINERDQAIQLDWPSVADLLVVSRSRFSYLSD